MNREQEVASLTCMTLAQLDALRNAANIYMRAAMSSWSMSCRVATHTRYALQALYAGWPKPIKVLNLP